jgi:hypothetical protein
MKTLLALTLALLVFAVSAQNTPGPLRVSALEIVDERGVVRARRLVMGDGTEPTGIHLLARNTPTTDRPATTHITLKAPGGRERVIRPSPMRPLLSLAVAVMVGSAEAADPAEIELVREGMRQQLSEAARARITEQMPKLFSTCSLNSRDHPRIFSSASPSATWQELQAKDHLIVRFATPLSIGHPHLPAFSARELLLGLADPRLAGPELSRNGENVVAHTKCSGGDMIKFVCAPELKPLMPASYHPLCSLLSSGRREP